VITEHFAPTESVGAYFLHYEMEPLAISKGNTGYQKWPVPEEEEVTQLTKPPSAARERDETGNGAT
jgi:hypothetical protein